MKIFMHWDMEGTSGIVHSDQTDPSLPEYQHGRRLMLAEVNAAIAEGVHRVRPEARVIAWDWGWQDSWAEGIIQQLPTAVALMSVSEWSLPIQRGSVESTVAEYSISGIGPGPRARRHWELARRRGLQVLAKIQAGNTWELSAVPYIPAMENVARHTANLRAEGVNDLGAAQCRRLQPFRYPGVSEFKKPGPLAVRALRLLGAPRRIEF